MSGREEDCGEIVEEMDGSWDQEITEKDVEVERMVRPVKKHEREE